MTEVWELKPHERLSFGRGGNIVIADDPDLDLRLGVLSCGRTGWQLRNAGASTTLRVASGRRPGGDAHSVFPGCSVELPTGHCWISFEVGSELYEIKVTLLTNAQLAAVA